MGQVQVVIRTLWTGYGGLLDMPGKPSESSVSGQPRPTDSQPGVCGGLVRPEKDPEAAIETWVYWGS